MAPSRAYGWAWTAICFAKRCRWPSWNLPKSKTRMTGKKSDDEDEEVDEDDEPKKSRIA